MTVQDKAKVKLDGVPETMLWPLWNRAYEAKRKDRLIDDPWSVHLVDIIDYDFERSFGKPSRGHGVRSRVGDDVAADFLKRFGDRACVVALGEGLETQYWRLGEPEVPWLSVDVQESIDVRRRLLPSGRSMSFHAFSALDERWMDEVPEGRVPFVSAMGLLMYFEQADVVRLLTEIARRFPSAELFFDTITPYFSRKTLQGFNVTRTYRAPPMPWGITVDDLPAFIAAVPGLTPVTVQTYAEPYPAAMGFYKMLSRIGPVRRMFAPSLAHAAVLPDAKGPQSAASKHG